MNSYQLLYHNKITNNKNRALPKEEIMAAKLLVFENDRERTEMCAGYQHDWANQPKIFGTETQKLLNLCEQLFKADLARNAEKVERLKKKLFGIAKTYHVYIKWYGMSTVCNEPDRFLVSGRGQDELAFIQC